MPARRAALAFIFVTVVLDMLAFGIVIPLLPKLVLHFEGGDARSRGRRLRPVRCAYSPACSSCSRRCWARSPTASAAAA